MYYPVLNLVKLPEEVAFFYGEIDLSILQLFAIEVFVLELDLFLDPIFSSGNGLFEMDHLIGDNFMVLELGLDGL